MAFPRVDRWPGYNGLMFPDDINYDEIDSSMRNLIRIMNRNTWMKTLWCCGGMAEHKTKGAVHDIYVCFCVRKSKLYHLLHLLEPISSLMGLSFHYSFPKFQYLVSRGWVTVSVRTYMCSDRKKALDLINRLEGLFGETQTL